MRPEAVPRLQIWLRASAAQSIRTHTRLRSMILRREIAILGVGCLFTLCAWSAHDQGAAEPLPRRGWLGAALDAAEGGVRVRELLPGSSAEEGGLQRGDLISKVGGKPVDG